MRPLAAALLPICALASPRFYAAWQLPSTHPLYARHTVKPPSPALFTPTNGAVACSAQLFCPGFAAIRGFDMAAPDTWEPLLDQYMTTLDVANMVWPDYRAALSPAWPQLASLLANRSIIATDLSGFVPGGMQDFTISAASTPDFAAGVAALGPMFLGMDQGEQDVRYLWGYAKNVVLPGPRQRAEQLVRFRDFSSAIELQSNATMVALASSTVGVHHWLKTGLYTLAGAETSQSNGNAQVLYAFVRGAAKQYGTLYYGQVSIFNWFGHKIPGDPSPTPQCASQSDHSPTCGTSLSLMKRLMYTQLSYDSAYFAFEGQWTYQTNSSAITPIGTLQHTAKTFFTAHSGSASGSGLGVHVPTIALLLDAVGGWARPCDTVPFAYTAAAWGNVPWDAADYWADAVIDSVWPGYRAGALMHDETGYLSPTPYGDAADVLLSDVLPAVLAQYDTIVLAHRAESDAAELGRRLTTYLAGGGNVVATASTLAELQAAAAAVTTPPSAAAAGPLGGVTIGACTTMAAGTTVDMADGTHVVEPLAFQACALSSSANTSWAVLASVAGVPLAVRVAVGNGSLTAIGVGNYGMATQPGPGPYYSCAVDEVDSRASQPYLMVSSVRLLLEGGLRAAAAFDLGSQLAWVPKRVAAGEYVLTVTNPSLQQAPLGITSLIGPIASISEMQLDSSEKGAQGYLPHGYAGANIGNSTNTTIAGADTRIFRVLLTSDNSSVVPGGGGPTPAPPLPAALWPDRRLLRLQPGTGDLRRQVLSRPSFDGAFGGLLVDWQYVWSREAGALAAEGQWLRLHGVSVAVDFSTVTNLFPGIRLCDDMGGYYVDSILLIQNVLNKMPALGATDALLTLHGTSEIPPANYSSDPVGITTASVRATLNMLSAQAVQLGITLHLRRTSRNDLLGGTTLKEQAAFAASAGIKIAPSLAYITIAGDATSEITSLLSSGDATLLLLSSAWAAPNGRFIEGDALAALPASQQPALQAVHAAAMAAKGAWVVMDAGYDSSEASGRAQELADAAVLQALAQ